MPNNLWIETTGELVLEPEPPGPEQQLEPWGKLPPRRGGVTMTIMFAPETLPRSQPSELIIDPDVRGGVPCVGPTRQSVSRILELLAEGVTPQQIGVELGLALADVQLALKASAWVMRDPAIDWQALNLPAMVEYQDEMQAWQAASAQALEKYDRPEE